MEIPGRFLNYTPRISVKHPNGRELDELVEEGDEVRCTIVSADGSDKNITVALAVTSLSGDEIQLEELPRYARSNLAKSSDHVVFDVYTVLEQPSGESHSFDSEEADDGSSGGVTEVYTVSCDQCGGQTRPDASYCPDCGERL